MGNITRGSSQISIRNCLLGTIGPHPPGRGVLAVPCAAVKMRLRDNVMRLGESLHCTPQGKVRRKPGTPDSARRGGSGVRL